MKGLSKNYDEKNSKSPIDFMAYIVNLKINPLESYMKTKWHTIIRKLCNHASRPLCTYED